MTDRALDELKLIAAQNLTEEMEDHAKDGADYEYAYNLIIKKARSVLASLPRLGQQGPEPSLQAIIAGLYEGMDAEDCAMIDRAWQEVRARFPGQQGWQPITKEIKRPVLVTNNIKARDAFGHMSHLWVATLVQRDPGYGFVTFDARDCRILGLTHYAEIPKP